VAAAADAGFDETMIREADLDALIAYLAHMAR
jgi:hypothetical protein